MGSKRRWADDLVAMLDADRPARVVLVDAGPWGETWKTLRDADARREVAALFDRWESSGERPNTLWSRLVAVPPYEDPVDRAAQYLWLQARSAGPRRSAPAARWLVLELADGRVGLWTTGANAAADEPWTEVVAELRAAPRDVGPCRFVEAVAVEDLAPEKVPDAEIASRLGVTSGAVGISNLIRAALSLTPR